MSSVMCYDTSMTKPRITPDGRVVFTPANAAKHLGVTTRTLSRWRRDGIGPAYYTSPRGATKYLMSAVDAYIESRTTNPVPGPKDLDLNATQSLVLHHMNHTHEMSISGEVSDLNAGVSHNQTMAKLGRYGLAEATDRTKRMWKITEQGLTHSRELNLCARFRCVTYRDEPSTYERQEEPYADADD